MFKSFFISILAAATLAIGSAQARDHPGHMTTAVIAFEEIKRERPELGVIALVSGCFLSLGGPT